MLWLVTWPERGKRCGRTVLADTSGQAVAWLAGQRPYVLQDIGAIGVEPYRTVAARRIEG